MTPRTRLFLFVFAAGLLGTYRNLQAATFVVDTTADDASKTACTAAAGDCSLRGAIIDANANGGADTITLPAGTYTLAPTASEENAAATGDLDIAGSLTLNGAGAATTIVKGGGSDRVFHIWPSTSPPGSPLTVTLNDITVSDGVCDSCDDGGNGILIHAGTVALNRMIVRDNHNDGPLEGGGILITGGFGPKVTVSRSTLRDNVTLGGSGGGGLAIKASSGSVTISNSTISGNSTDGSGGGVLIYSGTAALYNDTITRNTAGVTGGGVDIFGGNALKLHNTLLVENTLSAGGSAPDCNGTVAVSGFNIVSDTTSCAGVTDGVNDDHVGDDPKLDPLGLTDNGGPTPTIALLTGSPAINAGDGDYTSCNKSDQRGLFRPQGAQCDIGAYEKGICGDGFLEPEEGCDDGNTANGDGCSSACVDEVPGAVCGNGVLETGEGCDDNNTANGDGCSSACATEVPGGTCGNGAVETDEECDDGNVADGDGCSATCQSEEGGATSGATTGGSGSSGSSGGCSLIK